MSLIKCDRDSLTGKVSPSLLNGKADLDDSANILGGISIPSTFSLAGNLSAMPSTIINNGEKVNSFCWW